MKGKSLAEALAEQGPAFPDLLIGAVEVGEAAGALDGTLMSAASLLEKDEEAKAELKTALRYPVFVMLAVVGALVVLLTMVVPKFAQSYAQMGSALPVPTAILIQISQTLVNYWYYPLGVAAVIGIAGWRWIQTEKGRRVFESLLFRIPVVGSVMIKTLTSRTCEILRVLSETSP